MCLGLIAVFLKFAVCRMCDLHKMLEFIPITAQ